MTDSLSETLLAHQIHLPAGQIEQLDAFRRRLWQWNEKINLTRHTDLEKFVGRDVVDSVQLAGLLTAEEHVLDIGTGGGVPGLLLAILRPDVSVVLCDCVAKKAKVVADIAEALDLPVAIFAGRAEDVLQERAFNTLTARAVGPLPKLLTWLAPHWNEFDRLLAIKGPRWVEERKEARHRGLMTGLELRKVASYPMPGADGESVILQVWREEQ